MGFPSSRSRRRFPRCRSRGREELELFPVWHERFREPLNLPKQTDCLSAAWQKVSKRTVRISVRTLLIEPSIPPTNVWQLDLGNYVTPWRQEVVPGPFLRQLQDSHNVRHESTGVSRRAAPFVVSVSPGSATHPAPRWQSGDCHQFPPLEIAGRNRVANAAPRRSPVPFSSPRMMCFLITRLTAPFTVNALPGSATHPAPSWLVGTCPVYPNRSRSQRCRQGCLRP